MERIVRGQTVPSKARSPTTNGISVRVRSFKHEKFKVLAVIVDGDTPLAIMILEHKRIIDTNPRAPVFYHIVVR